MFLFLVLSIRLIKKCRLGGFYYIITREVYNVIYVSVITINIVSFNLIPTSYIVIICRLLDNIVKSINYNCETRSELVSYRWSGHRATHKSNLPNRVDACG